MNFKGLLQLYQKETCDLRLPTNDLHTEETSPAIYDIRNTSAEPRNCVAAAIGYTSARFRRSVPEVH
jgi:hypothetical protein